MCGVKLRDKLLCVELRQWLGMEDIVEVVQRKDGWHGHVLRKDEDVWVKECYFGGWGSQRGRPRKTRKEVVDKDVNDLHLKPRDDVLLVNGGKWLDWAGVTEAVTVMLQRAEWEGVRVSVWCRLTQVNLSLRVVKWVLFDVYSLRWVHPSSRQNKKRNILKYTYIVIW